MAINLIAYATWIDEEVANICQSCPWEKGYTALPLNIPYYTALFISPYRPQACNFISALKTTPNLLLTNKYYSQHVSDILPHKHENSIQRSCTAHKSQFEQVHGKQMHASHSLKVTGEAFSMKNRCHQYMFISPLH